VLIVAWIFKYKTDSTNTERKYNKKKICVAFSTYYLALNNLIGTLPDAPDAHYSVTKPTKSQNLSSTHYDNVVV